MKYTAGSYVCIAFFFICASSNRNNVKNYAVKTQLEDGQIESRIRFANRLVKETSVQVPISNTTVKEMLFRQAAAGPHLVQLIYKRFSKTDSSDEDEFLVECEYLKSRDLADQFREQFKKELHQSGIHLPVPHLRPKSFNGSSNDDDSFQNERLDLNEKQEQYNNSIVQILPNDKLPEEYRIPFDIKRHRQQCKKFLKETKKEIQKGHQRRKSLLSRNKRETFKFGIMPGTLWCGDGSLAEKYEAIGPHVGTDLCCRDHDACPFVIDSFSWKFGIFNYRTHTLSHCVCDEKFRSCLRQTGTGSANFVGKMFFNIAQTKCFVLKPEKYCAKRSGFDRCIYRWRKKAHLRNAIPY